MDKREFTIKARKNSYRLSEWNYQTDGSYFVTICTKNQWEYFGNIRNSEMQLNPLGKIIADCWQQIPQHFSNTIIDEWVVMPNHVHGIIMICDDIALMPHAKRPSHPESVRPLHPESVRALHAESVGALHPESVRPLHPESVRALHRESVRALHAESVRPLHRESVRALHATPLHKSSFMSHISPKSGSISTIIRSFKSASTRLIRQHINSEFSWHRTFHDHVIRNEHELNRIRAYIQNNPAKWEWDRNNIL